MRILVADGVAPFTEEPADGVATTVAAALRADGHQVDTVRIPRHPDATRTALATRLTDVSDVCDVLLAVGRPAHLLAHPRKVIWCTADAFAQPAEGPPGAGDQAAFDEAVQVLADSASARAQVLEWWDGTVDSADAADAEQARAQ